MFLALIMHNCDRHVFPITSWFGRLTGKREIRESSLEDWVAQCFKEYGSSVCDFEVSGPARDSSTWEAILDRLKFEQSFVIVHGDLGTVVCGHNKHTIKTVLYAVAAHSKHFSEGFFVATCDAAVHDAAVLDTARDTARVANRIVVTLYLGGQQTELDSPLQSIAFKSLRDSARSFCTCMSLYESQPFKISIGPSGIIGFELDIAACPNV